MTCLFDPACNERMPSEAPCRPTKKARSLSDIDFLAKDSDKINDRVEQTLDGASMMMDGSNLQDFVSEKADGTEDDAAAAFWYSVQEEALAMTGKFFHDHQW